MQESLNLSRLLEGRNAVVTSGAHGMGWFIACVLAKQGARVAINGRAASGARSGEILNAASPGSFFVQCDMSLKADAERFAETVLERMGHADIVVNNVGVNVRQHVPEIRDEDYAEIQEINYRGASRMVRAFLPGMIENGGGCFVHISSINSVESFAQNTSYSTSKGGINALSASIAADYAGYGVRSNILCPGGILTGTPESYIKMMNEAPEVLEAQFLLGSDTHPDYGSGSGNDIAHTCLFLVSELGRHITGQIVMVDGGVTHMSGRHDGYLLPPEHRKQLAALIADRYEFEL